MWNCSFIPGPVLSKFITAFHELATYKELLRSQVSPQTANQWNCSSKCYCIMNMRDAIYAVNVMISPQLCRYCLLWDPYSHGFVLPPKHTAVGEKTSTHWREITPYKHIPMCFFRRCGISWIVGPPFGFLQSTPLTGTHVGFTLPTRAWLWYHL